MPLITYPKNMSLSEVTITKSSGASTKSGLSLKKTTLQSGLVISGLADSSPLRGTAIQPGQLLLAINGNSELPSASAAASMISNCETLSLLVCDTPGCSSVRVVAVPFSNCSPGVNFASTRGRTLVTVSRIFERGPFARNQHVQEGDIVLAVNGIPVSKAEDADKALMTPKAGVTILHTVSMSQFRAAVIAAVDGSKILPQHTMSVFKAAKNPNEQFIQLQRGRGKDFIRQVGIEYDPETQHMVDPEPHKKMETDIPMVPGRCHMVADVNVRTWYATGVLEYIKLYNEVVDFNLRLIEEHACEHAWMNRTMLNQVSPHYSGSPIVVTATPYVPVQAPAKVPQIFSSNESYCNESYC